MWRAPLSITLAWEASIKIQREEDMDGDKKAAAYERQLSNVGIDRRMTSKDFYTMTCFAFLMERQERWVDIIGNVRQRRAALERVPLLASIQLQFCSIQ